MRWGWSGPDRWLSWQARRGRDRPGAQRERLGRISERWVARRMRRAGWRCLGERISVPAGEVDLVAFHQGALILVEVKSGWLPAAWRAQPPELWPRGWRPGDHFTAEQWRRYTRALPQVRTRLGLPAGVRERIDLVEVLWSSGSPRPILLHRTGIDFPRSLRPARRNPDSIQAFPAS